MSLQPTTKEEVLHALHAKMVSLRDHATVKNDPDLSVLFNEMFALTKKGIDGYQNMIEHGQRHVEQVQKQSVLNDEKYNKDMLHAGKVLNNQTLELTNTKSEIVQLTSAGKGAIDSIFQCPTAHKDGKKKVQEFLFKLHNKTSVLRLNTRINPISSETNRNPSCPRYNSQNLCP